LQTEFKNVSTPLAAKSIHLAENHTHSDIVRMA